MLVKDIKGGYRLGPLLHELGLAALPETNLRAVAEPFLHELTSATGDMAYLVGRSGYEVVCLDRIAGSFAIQTLAAGVGDRRPLGVGSAGTAILALLDDVEVEEIYTAVGSQLKQYGLDLSTLKERLMAARKMGYALDDGVTVSEVTAIARPICSRFGAPVGAVFVASIKSRMTPARRKVIDKQLAACVKGISNKLADG